MNLNLRTERVDDLPLLIGQMQQMHLAALLDRHFAPHGNWKGLSLGQLTVVWLSYILSQSDHRLSHLRPWATARLHCLGKLLGCPLQERDFTDDRLALVLEYLAETTAWEAFEGDNAQNLLRVYSLEAKTIRVDTTTASGYWQVDEAGLLQFGHSKDHRADLPQLKIALASLDPLGLPVVMQVVAGNCADDPLYIPVITQVQKCLGQDGKLYVGDCKMASLRTRAYLQSSGEYYLCPLSSVAMPPEELSARLQQFKAGGGKLEQVGKTAADGTSEPVAHVFEYQQPLSYQGQTWSERRVVVRSLKQAARLMRVIEQNLQKAQQELQALGERKQGKKRLVGAQLYGKCIEIVSKYGLESVVRLSYHAAQERVDFAVDEEALEQLQSEQGWRVYVLNQPTLSLSEVVWCYRNEYTVERCFGRLKGQPLSLSPTYLKREDHLVGLGRLLTLGIGVLTLLETGVRKRLAERQRTLAGLYAGTASRQTRTPSAELLLAAFKEVTLTLVELAGQWQAHLNALTPLQQEILSLLGLSPGLYEDLKLLQPKPS